MILQDLTPFWKRNIAIGAVVILVCGGLVAVLMRTNREADTPLTSSKVSPIRNRMEQQLLITMQPKDTVCDVQVSGKGESFAAVLQNNGKASVIINGKIEGPYTGSQGIDPGFSPRNPCPIEIHPRLSNDGSMYGYVADDSVYVNGKTLPGKPVPHQYVSFDAHNKPVYVVQDGKKFALSVGGNRGKSYDGISGVTVDPKRESIAYVAAIHTPQGPSSYKNEQVLVWNGKEYRSFKFVDPATMSFMEDGKLLLRADGNIWRVCASGDSCTPYDAMPIINTDGSVATTMPKDRGMVILKDGKEIHTHNGPAYGLTFAPDGRLAWFGIDNGEMCLYIDNVQIRCDVSSYKILFSPDGKSYSYVDGNKSVVHNDKTSGPFDAVYAHTLQFADDGSGIQFVAKKGSELLWVPMKVE